MLSRNIIKLTRLSFTVKFVYHFFMKLPITLSILRRLCEKVEACGPNSQSGGRFRVRTLQREHQAAEPLSAQL